MITFKLDSSAFRKQLHRYVDELGIDGREVVKDQTRLLLKQVIRFTPPKTLAQGRAAVARDIPFAMTPINSGNFPNPRMRERVESLAKKGDVNGLSAIFRNSDSWKMWRVIPMSPALHIAARDNRGRVRRSKHVFIPESESELRRYIRKVQGFVGRLKAAWGPAYKASGGSLPGWVARHASPRGTVTPKLFDKRNPSIRFSNFAVGVGQLRHPFASAMRARAKAMAGDIRRRMRKIAKETGLNK